MTEGVRPTFGAERRGRILDLVRAHGSMTLRDIAVQVGTSEVTVRRDVRALEADGLVDRGRGGVALPGRLAREQRRPARGAPREAQAIAELAAGLVNDGDAVALGPGTTSELLAHHLVERVELTVVTNALSVAQALAGATGVTVVMTGGTLHGPTMALTGAEAEQAGTGLRVRRTFLSAGGVNAERGLSTASPALASVERVLAAAAEEVVGLADHAVVGAEATVQTVAAEQLTHLVTDSNSDPELLLAVGEYGTQIHIAVPDSDRGQ
ncbi:DeoR/GlpR family DNA-binding transcription regulator [Lipingzhangella sp. LS1_29]|uniref:DeoR/GlpR family DNA-binding transcription regulator n=1 Tax=Lipingzhangella rawalii TaxID=2055835 RepID=A0ABU2H0T6_9ACTN|nr:DeoR/GlpR family DNA-binding transcription regulator [Lipingzhangella rawalii]MDS1268912.1 DeoR/GlpR family DNA-binding transcription regulator [Lipingzhangella rawalii]